MVYEVFGASKDTREMPNHCYHHHHHFYYCYYYNHHHYSIIFTIQIIATAIKCMFCRFRPAASQITLHVFTLTLTLVMSICGMWQYRRWKGIGILLLVSLHCLFNPFSVTFKFGLGTIFAKHLPVLPRVIIIKQF